jgi:hypothetical protein
MTSEPSVIEVSEALRAYHTFASELQLTNPAEVQDATRGLRFDKTPGPNGLSNEGTAASFTASDIPPSEDIQRFPPHSSHCTYMEAGPRDLHS